MICPTCGVASAQADRLWTCTDCGRAGCAGCMARWPGTTACGDCRGRVQQAARAAAVAEGGFGQARETRVQALFEAAERAWIAQHAKGD